MDALFVCWESESSIMDVLEFIYEFIDVTETYGADPSLQHIQTEPSIEKVYFANLSYDSMIGSR